MLLVDKIERQLKEELAKETYQISSRLPEEHALAKSFGVSRKTIRQALDRLKQENLIHSIRGKGTFVADSASRRLVNPTSMVGFMAPNFKHPMETSIVEGVREYLSNYDLDLILWSSDADPATEAKYLKRAQKIGLSGLIWWPHLPAQNHEFLQNMVDDGFPMVLVDRQYPGLDCLSVEPDHYNGMKEIITYLISLGHKKIGFITGSQKQREVVESIRLREGAYLDAMTEAGLKFDERWMVALDPEMLRCADVNSTAMDMLAYEPAHKLLALGDSRPTAIVLLFDELAPSVLKALKNGSLRVPGDISLVGFNDSPVAKFLEVPLTTVRYPTRKVGRLAGELMEKLIRGERVEGKRNLVGTELVIRSSAAQHVEQGYYIQLK